MKQKAKLYEELGTKVGSDIQRGKKDDESKLPFISGQYWYPRKGIPMNCNKKSAALQQNISKT